VFEADPVAVNWGTDQKNSYRVAVLEDSVHRGGQGGIGWLVGEGVQERGSPGAPPSPEEFCRSLKRSGRLQVSPHGFSKGNKSRIGC